MNLDKAQLDSNNHPLPLCRCVVCGTKLDSATRPGPEEERPRPGDLSLCLKCGEIYVFNQDMTIRVPTVAELMQCGPEIHSELEFMQNKIRNLRPLS